MPSDEPISRVDQDHIEDAFARFGDPIRLVRTNPFRRERFIDAIGNQFGDFVEAGLETEFADRQAIAWPNMDLIERLATRAR